MVPSLFTLCNDSALLQHSCLFSVSFLFPVINTLFFDIKDTNENAKVRVLQDIAQNLATDMPDFVLESRARTFCPPGRMGATCNYFCELGWQRSALTDGSGGFMPTSSLPPASVYLFVFFFFLSFFAFFSIVIMNYGFDFSNL